MAPADPTGTRTPFSASCRPFWPAPHFAASKRYPALLKYIVENTLAGKSDLLKERTLGVEVFDRPATYDTNADTVVRYTAGEVRKRLQLFYHEEGRHSSIRISLPAGSYVPVFLREARQARRTRELGARHEAETLPEFRRSLRILQRQLRNSERR
ncbi:MAG: hypothetical protein WDM87_10700 [Terracidiphilus sp.]